MSLLDPTTVLKGFRFHKDDYAFWQYSFIDILAAFCCLSSCILAFLQPNSSNLNITSFLYLLCSAATLVCTMYFRRKRKIIRASHVLLTFIGLQLYLFISGYNSTQTLHWLYLYPVIAFYLKGSLFGLLYSSLLFIAIYPQNILYSTSTNQTQIYFVYTAITLVLYIFSRGREQTRIELYNILKREKAQKQKIYELSIRDELTGLYNRRQFNKIIKRQLQHFYQRENQTYLSFLIIDIDYFKQYNDSYGHHQGDKALQQISTSLNEYFQRNDDWVFRLGGEEFGVIIQGQNQDDIVEYVQKACDLIASLQIPHKNSITAPYLTISIGLSILHSDEPCREDQLYTLADAALYKAKKNGRNQLQVQSTSITCFS